MYLCTELCCLEITPDGKEYVLAKGSSLVLTCSGSGETTWEMKRDDGLYIQAELAQSYQVVQNGPTTSVLTLRDVSWIITGVYQCIDHPSGETKEVAVFVPGEVLFQLI